MIKRSALLNGNPETTTSIVFDSAPALSSGVLFSVTPPAGSRIIVTSLIARDASQSNISVSVGGTTIYSGTLAAAADQASLIVGNAYVGTSANEYQGNGIVSEIQCGIDEVFEVEKTSGSTTEIIYLGYKVVK